MQHTFSTRAVRSGALALALTLAGCRENPTQVTDDTDPPVESHFGSADYALVFPQDSVNTVTIVMTAASWASVRADMTALYGFDFGVGGVGNGPGFPDEDPAYVPVTVTFNGKVWQNVGFRLKGSSSLSSAWRAGNHKLPFRLNLDEFEDAHPEIKNQDLHGFDELSMAPGFADPSLIRDKVVADIFRMAGVPAAHTAFYRVMLDFGEGLKYDGVYTMVEVIDDTMVEDQFGEDTGNIYKPESSFKTFDPAQFEKKNNKSATDYGDVRAAITALNSPLRTSDPARWRSELEAVFNVDHFVHWLAISNAIVSWDSYGTMPHNYYLYNDPSTMLTWIPWDHNQSMSGNPGITGATGGGGLPGSRQGLSLTMNEVSASWPLIRYIADDPVYFARYQAYLKSFRDEVFTVPKVEGRFDKYTALITPFVVGTNGEKPGYSWLEDASAFKNALGALKQHTAARRTLIDQFLK